MPLPPTFPALRYDLFPYCPRTTVSDAWNWTIADGRAARLIDIARQGLDNLDLEQATEVQEVFRRASSNDVVAWLTITALGHAIGDYLGLPRRGHRWALLPTSRTRRPDSRSQLIAVRYIEDTLAVVVAGRTPRLVGDPGPEAIFHALILMMEAVYRLHTGCDAFHSEPGRHPATITR